MAWNVPNFSLAGQPQVSGNWANGIMGVIDDNRAQKKASDILLARKQAQAQGPNAAQYLLSMGDVQGAQAYSQMSDRDADNAFRAQEAERAQKNADRSYGLQAQNAGRGDWDVTTLKGPDGSEQIVRYNKRTGEGLPQAGAQGQPQGNGVTNPYYNGKFTTEQGKVAGYTDRLSEAEAVLSRPEIAAQGTSSWNAGISGLPLPDAAKNKMMSGGYQQYNQAQRNFINATLRRESGAVISPEEFANARMQYFPQPGDDEATLAQKKANRDTVFQSFARESGPNYQPRAQQAPQEQQPTPEATKSLGGKNYIKINGQWYQQ